MPSFPVTINVLKATAKVSPSYQNKWISDENWAELVNQHFPDTGIDYKQINNALGRTLPYKNVIYHRDGETNTTGIYAEKNFDKAKKREVRYYLITEEGKTVSQPDKGKVWWDSITQRVQPT